jgi:endo-1,4-beta-xylanase
MKLKLLLALLFLMGSTTCSLHTSTGSPHTPEIPAGIPSTLAAVSTHQPTRPARQSPTVVFPSCEPEPLPSASDTFPTFSQVTPTTGITPAASSLRALADARRLWFGTAFGGKDWLNPEIASLADREFNMVAVGNAMKWEFVHPEPERYDFKYGDDLVAFARAHNMAVYAHVLVWENQLPAWLLQGNYTRDELTAILCKHIKTVVGHYRGLIFAWDVVNEAFDSNGSLRNNLWLRTLGPGYIAMAFQWAHEADPDALLIYNDFSAEGLNAKSQAIYALAQGLLQMGMPVDGIGFQMHVKLDGSPTPPELAANMQRLADLGLQVHITEMDVRTKDSSLSDTEKLVKQAEVYRQALSVCLAASNCNVFITWGTTDRYSWIREVYGPDNPLLFDDNGQPKPAYFAIMDVLKGP